MALVLMNILIGSLAATVFGIWAYKWFSRRSWLLAVIHSSISLASLAAAVALTVGMFHPLALTPALSSPLPALLVLLPTVARALELSTDEYSDAVVGVMKRELTPNNTT